MKRVDPYTVMWSCLTCSSDECQCVLGNCARMLWRCIKINTQTHTVQLYIFGPESQFDAVSSSSPLPMEFLRQKYWSGLPVPSPRDSPAPGSEFSSPALQMDSLPLSLLGSPQKANRCLYGKIGTPPATQWLRSWLSTQKVQVQCRVCGFDPWSGN